MVLGNFGGTPKGQMALGALYQRLRLAEKWSEAKAAALEDMRDE